MRDVRCAVEPFGRLLLPELGWNDYSFEFGIWYLGHCFLRVGLSRAR